MCNHRRLHIRHRDRARGFVTLSHFWARGDLETIAGLLRHAHRRGGCLSLPCDRRSHAIRSGSPGSGEGVLAVCDGLRLIQDVVGFSRGMRHSSLTRSLIWSRVARAALWRAGGKEGAAAEA